LLFFRADAQSGLRRGVAAPAVLPSALKKREGSARQARRYNCRAACDNNHLAIGWRGRGNGERNAGAYHHCVPIRGHMDHRALGLALFRTALGFACRIEISHARCFAYREK
jgi:hypothetical protein